MAQLGFICLLSDLGIVVSKDKSIIAIVYVDDVLFLGPNKKDLLHAKEEFIKKWECRDLGEAKEFLRMRIQHKNGRIYLDQTTYLQKVLQRFKLQNANPAHTPLPKGYQPSPNTSPVNPSCYDP
jgi:Reverse transcriptase (RNA-dependent DNA polymerase)